MAVIDDRANTPKRPPQFAGREYWAVILGGSSGMGLATARRLAREGMHLCLVHRDRRRDVAVFHETVRELEAEGIRCITFNLDATRDDGRSEVIDALEEHTRGSGGVRLLLHAVARGNLKAMTALPAEQGDDATVTSPRVESDFLSQQDFRSTVDAMALSLYDWLRDLFDVRLFAEDARVLGLTSEGNRKALRSYAAVSAAKCALEALCRSIALEFAPFGIRCNVVQPGVADTPSLRVIPGSEDLKHRARSRNPFGRLTRPEDVANVIYLLCRDEAEWINGAIIPVDGGEKNSG
jgi:enoyl-[acyl-carrier protein] reductase I